MMACESFFCPAFSGSSGLGGSRQQSIYQASGSHIKGTAFLFLKSGWGTTQSVPPQLVSLFFHKKTYPNGAHADSNADGRRHTIAVDVALPILSSLLLIFFGI